MRVPEDTELVPPRSPPSWCRRQSHLSPPSPGRVTADVPHLGWPLALHHMQEAQVCGVRWRETENPAKDQQTWGWDKDWPVKRRPRGHPIGGGGGIRQRRHARGRRRQSIQHNNTAPGNPTSDQNRGGRLSDEENSTETRLAMGMHTVAVKALRQRLDEGVTSTPLPMSQSAWTSMASSLLFLDRELTAGSSNDNGRVSVERWRTRLQVVYTDLYLAVDRTAVGGTGGKAPSNGKKFNPNLDRLEHRGWMPGA